jgi:Flp pilus assembly CpaE family ATPase
MSRHEAALRRATTGVVDPQVPDAFEEREPLSNVDWTVVADEPAEEAWPEIGPPVADPEEPERRLSPRIAPADGAETPRFREFSSKHADKLIVSTAMSAPLREHYRQLGATLHHAQAETGLKVVMVSSALPEEGKTLTATNIALTLSESYQRNVLLIDADLRRPSLDEVFQLPKVFGLSEALSAQDRPISLVQVSQRCRCCSPERPIPTR